MIVLDCSAAMEMVRDTDAGRSLKALCFEHERVASSVLLYPELCNAMRKYVAAGYLDQQVAAELIDEAIALVDEFHGFDDCVREVFKESCRLGHPSYDLFYFVLARRLGATLFTEDRHLIRLCEQNGVDCVHIMDLAREG